MEEVEEVERALRERGLTEKQVRAGVRYYLNFCKRHDINIAKSIRMITKMIENMKKRYEEL